MKSCKVWLAKRTCHIQELDQEESGEELDDDAKDDNNKNKNPNSEAKPDAASNNMTTFSIVISPFPLHSAFH